MLELIDPTQKVSLPWAWLQSTVGRGSEAASMMVWSSGARQSPTFGVGSPLACDGSVPLGPARRGRLDHDVAAGRARGDEQHPHGHDGQPAPGPTATPTDVHATDSSGPRAIRSQRAQPLSG